MDLVKIQEGQIRTDSLTVAETFSRNHADVLRDIKNLKCSKEFRLSNFAESTYTNKQNKKQAMYTMNRDGWSFLVMGFTGKKAAAFKEKYIAAFNAMELEIKTIDPMKALNDPAMMRGLLLTYTEKVLELESKVEEQTPKVEALDRISTSEGSSCITDTAKMLQIRPKSLFNYLSSNRWIYKRAGGRNWIAYQNKIQQGVLEHKITVVTRGDGSEKSTEQVRVTPKGITKLAAESWQ